jgi:hypothetical protein
MRCDEARLLESARSDGLAQTQELAASLDLHVADCSNCAAYRRELVRIRTNLRADLGPPPPLRFPPQSRSVRRPSYVLALAGAAAGLLVGLVIRSSEQPAEPAIIAGFTERLNSIQTEVGAFVASVTVVERGWHPEVPERSYRGWLEYRGPDQAAIVLSDVSVYPSADWVRNDIEAVVDRGAAWLRATQPCPAALQPGCSREPDLTGIRGRAPFEESALVSSDLVAPVRALATEEAAVASPGLPPVDSEVIGLRMSVAQAGRLLAALMPGGNWREFHPADQVDVWLSSDQLLPVAVQVWAVDDPARQAWAATRGYVDGDAALLELILRRQEEPPRWPNLPGALLQGEYSPGMTPGEDLVGLVPWGGGRLGEVTVESWAAGAAWIRLDRNRTMSATDWNRLIELETVAGVVYFDPGTATLWAVQESGATAIRGSVPLEVLAGALAEVGINGRPAFESQSVPPRGGLVLGPVEGFGPVSIRATADATVSTAWGGGTRVLALESRAGNALPPPVDPAVVGVEVRGTTARYSASAGSLVWVEAGKVYSLEAVGVTLAQLVEVAAGLVSTP